MEEGGEKWEVLVLPGVKTIEGHERDPREIGEVLWPQRHSIEKMEIVRARDTRTFEALYQQNPRPVMAGGEFWKFFDPNKHVREISYTPGLPVHIVADNNVNPYVAIAAWQLVDNELRQIMEFPCKQPRNNAPKAAERVCDWLDTIGYSDVVFIYGDPTANARSTVDENSKSFFDKFKDVILSKGYTVRDRVGKSSPEVALSAEFINQIYEQSLYGYSISISSMCAVSIEDYYTVKEDANGGMHKIKRKDPATGVTYEPFGHYSDNKRYFITQILDSDFTRYKARHNKTQIKFIPR
jgi:hypothetical protein